MASKTKIYIVLEFVTGGELFDKIATRGRLKEDEARNYFQQLINAVDYCHSRGVFHRDLKPENLLLDASGCLKVSDFGLSALPQQVREDGLLHTTYGTPNYVAPEVVGTLYTHHQKCVIMDTQAPGNNRRIAAFIGGLDLCDGRYDTPEHRLFRDLDTVFENDFHNPTFTAGTKGPRQPWHDLHCRIDGPAAYDVLKNFEQRWKKATIWSEFGRRFKKISHWHDDSLIKIERISWILSPSPTVPNDPVVWVSKEEDPENWHVQVFRSIDSGSVKGFPKDADSQNLVCAKNLVIDKSIHKAYIQAIRSAKNFIYIENQYFLGSSYAWSSHKDAGADHLIPVELALKIASKIRANERFSVYIVIPMWPEGVPSSASVQGILFWQVGGF